MIINNKTITMLKKLDWQQDFLEGFYSAIIPKGVLVRNAGIVEKNLVFLRRFFWVSSCFFRRFNHACTKVL